MTYNFRLHIRWISGIFLKSLSILRRKLVEYFKRMHVQTSIRINSNWFRLSWLNLGWFKLKLIHQFKSNLIEVNQIYSNWSGSSRAWNRHLISLYRNLCNFGHGSINCRACGKGRCDPFRGHWRCLRLLPCLAWPFSRLNSK